MPASLQQSRGVVKDVIRIQGAPRPVGAFSLGTKAGGFIFTAGRSSRDTDGKVLGETIEDQTRNVLDQISAILAEGGASMADIVKATVHLSDLSLFSRYNTVYAELVPEPRPARTTVGSQLGAGVLVEIDVVAYVGDEKPGSSK